MALSSKTAGRVFLFALAGLFVVSMVRNCGLDAKYKAQKTQYEAYRAIAKADMEVRGKVIEEQGARIKEQDGIIATAHGQIDSLMTTLAGKEQANANLTAEAEKLRTQVQPVIDANPMLKAYVFNLTEQIRNLNTQVFTLKAVVVEKDKEIGAWKAKFDAQVVIADEWHEAYLQEHGLRLSCEDLVKSLEIRVKGGGLWGTAKKVGIGIVAGFVLAKVI